MRVPETPLLALTRRAGCSFLANDTPGSSTGVSSARNTIETILQRGDQRATGGREGTAMKRCAQCHGKLGLGVRSRNVWNGRWWVHVRYCSTHCEALHELERYDARGKRGRHEFIPRSSPQN